MKKAEMKTQLRIQVGSDEFDLDEYNQQNASKHGMLQEDAELERKSESITPTTLQKRVFFNKDSKFINDKVTELAHYVQQDLQNGNQGLKSYETFLNNAANMTEYFCFVDIYKHDISNTLRYGINNVCINISEKDFAKNVMTGDGLELVKEEDLKTQSSQQPASTSNSASNSINTNKHSIEKFVFQCALDDFLHPQNKSQTILVDIFDRNKKDGKVKMQKKHVDQLQSDIYYPKTHTVVLYKNDVGKVLVIDPSNFSFSKHLSDADMMLSDHHKRAQVEIIDSTWQIYKVPSKKDTGAKHNLYRDCIDIAVKLAFGLNVQQPYANKLTKDNIKKSEVVKMISNQPTIDVHILTPDLPTRIKQASDVHVVTRFNNLEYLADKTLKNLLSKNKALCDQFQRDYNDIISKQEDYTTINTYLYALNEKAMNGCLGMFNDDTKYMGD